MSFLPDGEGMSATSLLFMTAVYGYVLLTAAVQLGEGSEMLMAVLGPGIVGGLLIPILGAVPDGMIILFSGLSSGTEEEQLSRLDIGLGTLAGSTVCLLTLPWAGAVLLGWRDLDPNTGLAMCKFVDGVKVPKADGPFSWFHSGVTVTPSTAKTVKVMMATSLCYLIIQIPAAVWSSLPEEDQVENEHIPALIGLIVSILGLLGYCVWQMKSSTAEENQLRKAEESRIKMWQYEFGKTFGRFDQVVNDIFSRFDTNHDGTLDPGELGSGLKLLGLPVTDQDLLDRVVKTMDLTGDGKVSLPEFRKAIKLWMSTNGGLLRADTLRAYVENSEVEQASHEPSAGNEPIARTTSEVRDYMTTRLTQTEPIETQNHNPYYGEVEELAVAEEHVENNLWKGCMHLTLGMTLVLVFSDPMVNVLENLAEQIGVGAFYVSFVVTPLASNASEVYSALYFAKSKTGEKVSMAHASLYGAACMNNTFCLAIFFLIIYVDELPWDYSAETMCILMSELGIAALGYKRTIPAWKALIAISIYPLAIIFVIISEIFW